MDLSFETTFDLKKIASEMDHFVFLAIYINIFLFCKLVLYEFILFQVIHSITIGE